MEEDDFIDILIERYEEEEVCGLLGTGRFYNGRRIKINKIYTARNTGGTRRMLLEVIFKN